MALPHVMAIFVESSVIAVTIKTKRIALLVMCLDTVAQIVLIVAKILTMARGLVKRKCANCIVIPTSTPVAQIVKITLARLLVGADALLVRNLQLAGMLSVMELRVALTVMLGSIRMAYLAKHATSPLIVGRPVSTAVRLIMAAIAARLVSVLLFVMMTSTSATVNVLRITIRLTVVASVKPAIQSMVN